MWTFLNYDNRPGGLTNVEYKLDSEFTNLLLPTPIVFV